MKNLLLIITLFVFITSCGTQHKVSNQNLSALYKKEATTIHPKMVVQHTSESQSTLYFKVYSKELLYTKQNNEEHFTARVKLQYQLRFSFDSQEAIDTGSILVLDTNDEGVNKEIIGHLMVATSQPINYVLEVNTIDLNRGQNFRSFINVDKRNALTGQNFLVKSENTGEPLFRNNLMLNEKILLAYREQGPRKIMVKYYKDDFQMAAPPFSEVKQEPLVYKVDSIFWINSNEAGIAKVELSEKGMYRFQIDSSKQEGITLFRYYNDFPTVKTTDKLLEPLRYITSKQEYLEMETGKNLKTAIDNFWLKTAGNPDRAKELIRKFYNRVQDANNYFSSYLEGWKTDRGMIYIVYGPPSLIYKSSTSETWVYGEANNVLATTYIFEKMINTFSDNDYMLSRSPAYKGSWYQAVDMWRQGRIYLDN